MTNVVKLTKHRVISGIEIWPCGTIRSVDLPISRARYYMSAPIPMDGPPIKKLYFMNCSKRDGFNSFATRVFGRDGFHIYGPAIIAASSGVWHCLRVMGSEGSVRRSISHLTLGAHAIVPTSRRDTHQDVIAKDLADITMLKMVL